MIRLPHLALALFLGVSAPAMVAANTPTNELCARVGAFGTLSGLCETVMRIFPGRSGQKPVASEPAPAPEPELARPLDLTLPPGFALGDDIAFEPPKPLLPPLFGRVPDSDPLTLGGRLITSEEDAEFEFDLSRMIDRIEGAEIRIQIRQ